MSDEHAVLDSNASFSFVKTYTELFLKIGIYTFNLIFSTPYLRCHNLYIHLHFNKESYCGEYVELKLFR